MLLKIALKKMIYVIDDLCHENKIKVFFYKHCILSVKLGTSHKAQMSKSVNYPKNIFVLLEINIFILTQLLQKPRRLTFLEDYEY